MPKEGEGARSSKAKKVPPPTKTALRVERAKQEIEHAGQRFGYKHQIFIAKLKRGEVWALNQLSYTAKTAITPLFEMWPPNPGTKTKPVKSLSQHTSGLMQLVATEWTGLPCFIDTKYLTSGGVSSPSAVQTVFQAARNAGVIAIPVTSPFFRQAFQQAVQAVIAADGRGVLIRVTMDFFNDITKLKGYLDGLSTVLGVGKNQIDIAIDLEYRPNVVEVQQMGAFCLDNLPDIDKWRTVTLAAGCFPDSISGLSSGQWIPFNRSDWNGWNAIVARRTSAGTRIPSYGDYGVRCGGEPKVIPNAPAPNLRYTANGTIYVMKGLKATGSMRAICKSLLTQQYFSGQQFSQGDTDIAQKAATTNLKNGSPEQWIQWCTNHHLEYTFSQIQNLP